jgi:hypothetical protein
MWFVLSQTWQKKWNITCIRGQKYLPDHCLMGFACTLWQVQSSKFKSLTVKIGNAPWSSPKMNLRFTVIPGKWIVLRMWDEVRATSKSLPTRESHQYVGSHENYIIYVLWCVQFHFQEMSCKVLSNTSFQITNKAIFLLM